MNLPAVVPPELRFLTAVHNEQELLDVVMARPVEQSVLFFESATADVVWADEHLPWLSSLLAYFNRLFLTRQLPQNLLIRVSLAIQRQYRTLDAIIAQDLAIVVRGRHFEGNALLFSAASDALRDMILDLAPVSQGRPIALELGGTSLHVWEAIADFVLTGNGNVLLTRSKDELLECLVQAVEWGMPAFRERCIQALKHYIDPQVTIELLATSQYYHMADLRAVCCERWNQFVHGFHLESHGEDELAAVIMHYHASERPLLDSVIPLVTRFALRGDAALDPLAVDLLQRAKRVKSFDLSETNGCLPAILETAPAVTDLRLAGCFWLDEPLLLQWLARFPALRRLDLGGNTHFSQAVWRRVHESRSLESLRLAHCHQLTDTDVSVLVNLLGEELRELDVSWCIKLTDVGVHKILHACNHLVNIDLSHCPAITDRSVRDLTQKVGLQVISLASCMAITDEPVTQLALDSAQLRQLNLSYCRLGNGVIATIKRRRPTLHVET